MFVERCRIEGVSSAGASSPSVLWCRHTTLKRLNMVLIILVLKNICTALLDLADGVTDDTGTREQYHIC